MLHSPSQTVQPKSTISVAGSHTFKGVDPRRNFSTFAKPEAEQ